MEIYFDPDHNRMTANHGRGTTLRTFGNRAMQESNGPAPISALSIFSTTH